jgi:transcriptional regulator with XRE-family HTH domain
MATDQGPVVSSALVRGELVRLRREGGLTQQNIAKELEWSTSKLIRIEGGHSSITKVDLDALLDRYRIPSQEGRDRLHALNRGAKEPGWWDRYRGIITPAYLDYVGFEAGATFIRHSQIGFVPALLQTAEYARAVTLLGSTGAADETRVAAVVELRLQRQQELERREVRPRRHFVLDEAVIRRHIGIRVDPSIMPDQLRAIADKAEGDDPVTVQVISFGAGEHAGEFGPFTLLEFDGGLPDILYIDPGRGGITMIGGDDPQVARYADDFEELLEIALSPAESIKLIRSVADKIS